MPRTHTALRAAWLSALGMLVAAQASTAEPRKPKHHHNAPHRHAPAAPHATASTAAKAQAQLEITTYAEPARHKPRLQNREFIDPDAGESDYTRRSRTIDTCTFAVTQRDGTLVVSGRFMPQLHLLSIDTPDGSQTLTINGSEKMVLETYGKPDRHGERPLVAESPRQPFPHAFGFMSWMLKRCERLES